LRKVKLQRGAKIVRIAVFEKKISKMQAIHSRLDDLKKNFVILIFSKTTEISESKIISMTDSLPRAYIFVTSKGWIS
jgi:hypothetical protein